MGLLVCMFTGSACWHWGSIEGKHSWEWSVGSTGGRWEGRLQLLFHCSTRTLRIGTGVTGCVEKVHGLPTWSSCRCVLWLSMGCLHKLGPENNDKPRKGGQGEGGLWDSQAWERLGREAAAGVLMKFLGQSWRFCLGEERGIFTSYTLIGISFFKFVKISFIKNIFCACNLDFFSFIYPSNSQIWSLHGISRKVS